MTIFSVSFYITVLVVMLLIRTIFRYAAISGYCNSIIVLEPPEKIEKSLHAPICADSYQSMNNERVFIIFPANLFFSGTLTERSNLEHDTSKKHTSKRYLQMSNIAGWFVSLFFAAILSLALVWMFK